jgi:hypothetical protein
VSLAGGQATPTWLGPPSGYGRRYWTRWLTARQAHGGAAFVQSLSRLGLIDEYRLVILPVALGAGLPLFKDLVKPLRMDLTEARSFPDGTVIHVYRLVTG